MHRGTLERATWPRRVLEGSGPWEERAQTSASKVITVSPNAWFAGGFRTGEKLLALLTRADSGVGQIKCSRRGKANETFPLPQGRRASSFVGVLKCTSPTPPLGSLTPASGSHPTLGPSPSSSSALPQATPPPPSDGQSDPQEHRWGGEAWPLILNLWTEFSKNHNPPRCCT